jgi:hypothetical protein
MPKTKPRSKRIRDTDYIGTVSDLGCVSLTAEAMIVIGEQIEAARKEWRCALGIPQGLEIPDKPLPATEEERLAELAEVVPDAGPPPANETIVASGARTIDGWKVSPGSARSQYPEDPVEDAPVVNTGGAARFHASTSGAR